MSFCRTPKLPKSLRLRKSKRPHAAQRNTLPESQREVTLRFEQIERILNDKLPASAHEDRRWWESEKEGNHVNARSWSNAGWKVESLDFNEKWAKLVRAGWGVSEAVFSFILRRFLENHPWIFPPVKELSAKWNS